MEIWRDANRSVMKLEYIDDVRWSRCTIGSSPSDTISRVEA